MRDRLAELDAEIARDDAEQRAHGRQQAVLKMASWAMDYWPRWTADRHAFLEFLKREFRLVGKACTKCNDWKPRKSFHKNARNPDGLQTWCIACIKTLLERPNVKEDRRRAVRKYRQKLRQTAD